MTNNKKNKGGAPTKPEDQKKKKEIKIRLTEAQYNFILNHAEAAGYKQPGRFLSVMIWRLVADGKFTYAVHETISSQIVNQLMRIGNSLNQAMKAYHESGDPENLDDFEYLLMKSESSIDIAARRVGRVRKVAAKLGWKDEL